MSQSLAVAGPEPGRISQILPAVKCSTCHQPVPIAELGEHICAAPPPMPAAAPKPPMSPTSATFFQQKYQKLISSQNPTPSGSLQPIQAPPRAASVPPRQNNPPPPQRASSTSPEASSQRRPSVASLNVPNAQGRPERVPSPLARESTSETSRVAFPSRGGSTDLSSRAGSSTSTPRTPSPRVPSPLSPRHHPSEPTPVSPPMSAPNRTSSEPTRYMSPAPPRAPSAASIRGAPPARTPSAASMRGAPPAVRPPAISNPPPPIAGLPMANTAPLRPRASTNVPGPLPEPGLIYATARPQAGPSRGPPLNVNVNVGQPSIPVGGLLSPASGHVEIDTKIGGSAGMAGVGRRGFAAAARAAMFAHTVGMQPSPQSEHPPFHLQAQTPGLDGRRANAPRYLDISSAVQYNSAHTPPLSPGSTSSAHSPRSGGSPLSASIPSPRDGRTSVTPTQPAIARTPSPLERVGSIISLRDRVLPPQAEPPKVPLPATPSTPSLPFFEKLKNKVSPLDTKPPAPPAEESPLSPDESEFEGLAYADDDDDEDEPKPDADESRSTVHGSTGRVRFPSVSADTHSRYSSGSSSSGVTSPRLPLGRSLSQSTASTLAPPARTPAKSTGALDRAMETLFEEEDAPADDPHRESMRPKLPVRSHTSPGLRPESRRRAPRTRSCLSCARVIEDGRWIQMEGAGVMCDRCWKNMYLPKCRRCNLTIEKHAVSSSDGQLKGKYHRDCFNCHTCHKPFPDKTFYVLDGKPFCEYHYHEANRSLCAAASCGMPIEGPCAVAAAGARYHPEHFLCEHPRCAERLVEYWEVDGRVFCDRHAGGVGGEDDDEEPARATKRKTVFIDLAGAGLVD